MGVAAVYGDLGGGASTQSCFRPNLVGWLKGQNSLSQISSDYLITVLPSGLVRSEAFGQMHIVEIDLFGLEGSYYLRFSDFRGEKLAHILSAESDFSCRNFCRNFEIGVSSNRIVLSVLSFWKRDRISRDIKAFLDGEKIGLEPQMLNIVNGSVYLFNMENRTVSLRGFNGRNREAIGVHFSEKSEISGVIRGFYVFEADNRTLLRKVGIKKSESGDEYIIETI